MSDVGQPEVKHDVESLTLGKFNELQFLTFLYRTLFLSHSTMNT
jgi:hypothetical protein